MSARQRGYVFLQLSALLCVIQPFTFIQSFFINLTPSLSSSLSHFSLIFSVSPYVLLSFSLFLSLSLSLSLYLSLSHTLSLTLSFPLSLCLSMSLCPSPGPETVEVRYLMKQMAKRIAESDRTRLTSSAISDALFGLQGKETRSCGCVCVCLHHVYSVDSLSTSSTIERSKNCTNRHFFFYSI